MILVRYAHIKNESLKSSRFRLGPLPLSKSIYVDLNRTLVVPKLNSIGIGIDLVLFKPFPIGFYANVV